MKKEQNKNKEPRPYRWLRRILRILGGIVIFIILLLLFIRSPWGQNIIVDKALSYVSDKTNTEVDVENFYITFDGNLLINGLYLEDKKGDTLIYTKSLEADIPFWGTITGETYGVENVKWETLKANITRKDTLSGFNFQFLIDAFASQSSTSNQSTAENSADFTLGDFELSDFDVVFNDAVSGIESRYKFEKLRLNIQSTDLDSMNFEASNLYLEKSMIKVIQLPVKDESESETTLPKFSVDKLNVVDNETVFKSSEIELDLKIDNLKSTSGSIDLGSQNYDFENILLQESFVGVDLKTTNGNSTNEAREPNAFEWPPITLNVLDIEFDNNIFKYTNDGKEIAEDSFDPQSLQFSALNLNAKHLKLKNGFATADFSTFSFKESSGLNLNRFSGNISFSNTELNLQGLNLNLNSNNLVGSSKLRYEDIDTFINSPELSQINVDIKTLDFLLSDIFLISPELKSNQYIEVLGQKPITGQIFADGSLSQLNVSALNLSWGNTSQIRTAGTLFNPTQIEKLAFSIPEYAIDTQRKDILKFVNENQINFKLPESIALTGTVEGEVDDFYIDAKLKSSHGIITTQTEFSNQKNRLAYNTSLQIEEYQINELLENNLLGKLSMDIESSGTGQTLYDLDAKLDAQIHNFTYNDYAFNDIYLNGKLRDGSGKISTNYKDDNLNFDLKGNIDLDSVQTQAELNLDVAGARLSALGLSSRDLKTAFDLKLNLNVKENTYDADADFSKGVVVINNETYLIGAINAQAYVSPDSTAVEVHNRIADLELKSNASPTKFTNALTRHVKSYFYRDTEIPDTIKNTVNVEFKGKLAQSPFLKEVLLVNLRDLDTVQMSLNFEEKKRKLEAKILAPHINYFQNEIDSLKFNINTDKNDFVFNLQFKNIQSGPINIPETIFSGLQQNNELDLSFEAIEDKEKLIYFRSKISGNRDRLKYQVIPDSLILNKQSWQVSENNSAILTSDSLIFQNFKIQRNNQSIHLKNTFEKVNYNHAGISFENFNLKTILNYLNPDAELAKGVLSGNFILVKPFEKTGILADIEVNNFSIINTNLGKLTIDASSKSGNTYVFNSKISGGLANIDLQGDYTAQQTSASLNLDLDINKFKMRAINSLSMGVIEDSEGNFSGHFDITGDLNNPKYQGQLNFENAKFNISKLNSVFELENESMTLKNSEILFDDFTLKDINNNKLKISGKIGTENLFIPTFDINLNAKHFKVLDSNKEDNDLFFGKVIIDADAEITGDLDIPKVDGNLKIDPKTDFTYIIPPSVASIEKRSGVVRFVNKENTDNILTSNEEEIANISGYDIDAEITVSDEAKFKIVIDERTGDNFVVQGSGDLNLKMFPNGRINLFGLYEATSGHYELNLYDLVKRKFNLVSGSQVKWNGDPFNADLDVTALYNVETSASSLMASTTSSLSNTDRGRFRQVLPFEVYLNIKGEIFQPKIDFRLDMPEDERSAIRGQVYSRLQQVNQQGEELNQQVFSLLVLNRFYPAQGSDGTGGGFSSLAQQNLNDAISDRLNNYSDQLLGNTGIELDFGLNSFTDYQGNSPQQRTQLNVAAQKKLLNDRLTVRVGSDVDLQGSNQTRETPPVVGNVSLIYELTKDGRYRLKGFRRERFENIIDGQVIVSGIALIFTKEFNRFRELWQSIFSDDVDTIEIVPDSTSTLPKENEKKQERKTENK